MFTPFQTTLESGIDVEQEINLGPGKFDKNSTCRAFDKPRKLEHVTHSEI